MALRIMRDNLRHLKWIIVLVILSFIMLMFLEWGGGNSRGGLSSSNSGDQVLVVSGVPVSFGVFRYRVTSYKSQIEQYLGKTERSKEMVINSHLQVATEMVNRIILGQEAKKLGLEVSDQEIANEVKRNFSSVDNPFDKEVYKKFCLGNGFTMEEFEAEMRWDLLADKYRSFLQASISVPAQEVEETYRDRIERVVVDYALFRPSSFVADADEPSDDEVQAHFDANQESFRIPQRKVGALFVLNRDILRQRLEVTDEKLEAYYNGHKSAFLKPEDQRRASHILFKFEADTTPEQKNELTDKIVQLRTRAKNGEDFANLAKNNSEGPSNVRGGDLGWFGRGAMVPAFEEAVFSPDNKVNDVIGPVFTDFGVHIIKVTGMGGEESPFHEVKEQVKQQYLILGQEAVDSVEAEFELFSNEMEGLGSYEALTDYFTQNKLRIYQVPSWAKGDPLPRFGRNDQLEELLDAMDSATLSPAEKINDELVVVGIKEVKDSYLPELGEVKIQVVKSIKENAVEEIAFAKANQLLALGVDLENFQINAEEFGAEAYQRITVSRDGTLGGIKTNEEFREMAFATDPDLVPPPVKIDEGIVAFLVRERFDFDSEKFAEEKTNTRDGISQQRILAMINEVVTRQRETLDENDAIYRDQEMLDSVGKWLEERTVNWNNG